MIYPCRQCDFKATNKDNHTKHQSEHLEEDHLFQECYQQFTHEGSLIGHKNWSEWSACAALGCRHKRRWPLFLVIITLLLVGVFTAVIKTPEGVVVGFQIFALAPN
jgi:hypothetical protein